MRLLLLVLVVYLLVRPSENKRRWLAVVTNINPCDGPPLPVQTPDFKLTRQGAYTSVITGHMNITEDLEAPLKMIADTYSEGATGARVKRFTFTYPDICKLIKGPNKFIDPVFDGSDVPRECPILKGVYTWHNVTYQLSDYYDGFILRGKFVSEGHVYMNGKKMYCLRTSLDLRIEN